jgi:hypothetical protein
VQNQRNPNESEKKMFVAAGIKIQIDDESDKYNSGLLLLPE